MTRGATLSWISLFGWVALCTAIVVGLTTPLSGSLELITVADPWDGFWRTARNADRLPQGTVRVGGMNADVVWDERAVPHIFASSDSAAIAGFGFVVAHDRLFQMDFLRRVTSGRLAEVLGEGLLPTDRFLRATGMSRAVQSNMERIRASQSVDYKVAEWFATGVNAYLTELQPEDLPFEFRLLGYQPEAWKPEDSFLVGWNLIFDLTFQREGASVMQRVRDALPASDFDFLFPVGAPFAVPIVHPGDRHWPTRPVAVAEATPESRLSNPHDPSRGRLGSTPSDASAYDNSGPADFSLYDPAKASAPPAADGFLPGKGSNNWAVGGRRSSTGRPILSGDMHLSLSLPAIWYEVHMVTPTMNTYGVTVPGVPLPIEAFNPHLGWAFTNTGSDQIDHLRLEVNSARTQYRYEGAWRDLETVVESIDVLNGPSVADTVLWSHWGPVSWVDRQAIATQWTGHGEIRTFQALWEMNHASTYASFERALRLWDAPMQNILVAAPGDTIAIRSTGWLPIRADGTGYGVRDGSTRASEWIGRVPFDELPHTINPDRAYLASTNQRPADESYPYYLGRDWGEVFRSIRIDQLLSSRESHTPEQIAEYQSDVHAVQWDMFVPLLADLDGLSDRAVALRAALQGWDGEMVVDRREPVLFAVWDGLLQRMAWDEPVFASERPERTRLYELLTESPDSKWLDIQSTDVVEDAGALLVASLEAAADSVSLEGPEWGEVHGLVIRHITGSTALKPIWRGPYPYPGFAQTLSPGSRNPVTFSASWRVLLDLEGESIAGRGVYPGGQSGNPFSSHYDDFIEAYVAFEHFPLQSPETIEDLAGPSFPRLQIRP